MRTINIIVDYPRPTKHRGWIRRRITKLESAIDYVSMLTFGGVMPWIGCRVEMLAFKNKIHCVIPIHAETLSDEKIQIFLEKIRKYDKVSSAFLTTDPEPDTIAPCQEDTAKHPPQLAASAIC